MKIEGVLILILLIIIGAFLIYATCKIVKLVQMSREQLRNILRNIKIQIQLIQFVDSKIADIYSRLTTMKLEMEAFFKKQQENKKMKIKNMISNKGDVDLRKKCQDIFYANATNAAAYSIIFPKDKDEKNAKELLELVDGGLYAIEFEIEDKSYWGVLIDNEEGEKINGNSEM